MTIFILITVVAVTPFASHTQYHFKPPFKEPDKPIVLPAHTLTWEELLAYGTSVRFMVRSQHARSAKAIRLYFLDWTLRPVLATRLHISNHLVLGVYNPLHPQNTSLIQTVTHTRCHLAMKVKERHRPLKDTNEIRWALPNSLYWLPRPFLYLPFFKHLTNGSLCAHPISFVFFYKRTNEQLYSKPL